MQFKTESSSSHGMSWAKAFTEKNVEVNFPYSVSTVIPQGAPCRCEGEGVNSNGSNNGRDSNLTGKTIHLIQNPCFVRFFFNCQQPGHSEGEGMGWEWPP